MKELGTRLLLFQPPKVTYLGVAHYPDRAEYGFEIQTLNETKTTRFVRIAIPRSYFRNGSLMVQEAPDLCYQKVRADAGSKMPQLRGLAHITESDISEYRASHSNQKSPRKSKHQLPTGGKPGYEGSDGMRN